MSSVTSEVSTSTAILKDPRSLSKNPLDLYEYLWSKSNEIHPSFSFYIPETVIFHHQTPIKWIFTSKKEKGKILSKKKVHLSIEQVLTEFSSPKNTSSQNIQEKNMIVATYAYIQENEPDRKSKISLEHLTKERLTEVLLYGPRPPMSILQRFIPTKTGYNHMIMSIFSSENCIIRKCVNTHLVSDLHVDIASRTATFEAGQEDSCHTTRDVNVRDMKQQIEKINREISRHLMDIVGQRLSRFVSYFKVSLDGQIYLIMSSLVSFGNPDLACTRYYELSLPFTSNNVESSRQGGVMKACITSDNISKCLNCTQAFQKEQVSFLVTYRSIIRCYESTRLPCFNGDDVNIPSLFRHIYPYLTEERYQQLKNKSNFLYDSVSLCRGCADLINSTAMKLSFTIKTNIRNQAPPKTLRRHAKPSQSVPCVAPKQDQAVPRKPSLGNVNRTRPGSAHATFSRSHRPYSARNPSRRRAPSFDFKSNAEQESVLFEPTKRAQPEIVSINVVTSPRPSTGNPSSSGMITAPQIPAPLRPERPRTSVGFNLTDGASVGFRRRRQSLDLKTDRVDSSETHLVDSSIPVSLFNNYKSGLNQGGTYEDSVHASNGVSTEENQSQVEVTRLDKMNSVAHQSSGQQNNVIHEDDVVSGVSVSSRLEMLDLPEFTEEERQVLEETLNMSAL